MSVIQAQIVKATKWSSITEIVAKLISPITNMILARLLAPEAFGAIATINMVISFAELFTDAGFQKFLIQHEFKNEDALNESTNVAFWTNFSFSIFIWGIIVCFKDFIAELAGNPDLGIGVAIASVAIVIYSFSSIQMARLKRDFDFKTLFYVRIVAAFLPLVVTVPLAFVLKNYWALIIGALCSQIAQGLILLKFSKWRPKLQYSLVCLKEMFAYSMWTMFESVSIWLTSYMGTFIVGNILNDYYLGLYKTSMSTVNAYMAIITAATTPVLFSALSRLQNDETQFKSIFFKFQRLVALFVMPMGAGIYLYRDLVTRILLGVQWLEAADFIGLWGLMSGITIIFSHYNSEVYRSKGKPKISLLVQVLHLVVLIPILIWAANKGFTILYIARSFVRIQLILVGTIVLWFKFNIKPWEVIRNVLPTILGTSVMVAGALVLNRINKGLVWEFVSIVICILIYFTVIMCMKETRKEVLGLIKKFVLRNR